MGQVLILGLIAGGIYGLLAVGIVLVYRGSGALNFAQGEIGTFSLYTAYLLVVTFHLPWIVGAIGAVATAAFLGLLFEWAVVRRMVEATRVSVAVATSGLLLFLLSFELVVFSASPRILPPPIHGRGIRLFGVFVSPTQFLALGVTLAVAAGLALVLKRTDFGLGVLAAAQDPVAVQLVGVPLRRVSAFIWATGAAVTALGALLLEPTIGVFVPGFASDLFLRALAAAVVGGLTSLPGAFVGGLAVGVIEAGAGKYFSSAAVPGIQPLTVFLLILAVLLFRPQGIVAGLSSRTRAA